MIEVLVSLNSRADLGRPKENARENKEAFMKDVEICRNAKNREEEH